jgi:glycosyltransferase involved in cell wall biosynthesis
MKKKSRIALVSPRFGDEVVGGSENLIRNYAELLKDDYEIDVLTTNFINYGENPPKYNEGLERKNGYNIMRFKTHVPSNKELVSSENRWERYGLRQHSPFVYSKKELEEVKYLNNTPVSYTENFIRSLGHYSETLSEYLYKNSHNYKKIILTPYLYSTTMDSLDFIPRDKVVILLAAHKEPYIHFPCFRKYFGYNIATYFKSELDMFKEAQNFNGSAYKESTFKPTVGNFLSVQNRNGYDKRNKNRIVFLGRASYGKGVAHLIPIVEKYRERTGHKVELLIIGDVSSELKEFFELDWVNSTGRVDNEQERFHYVATSLALINPSVLDSFGLVNLEAARLGTPVILNTDCPAFHSLNEISNKSFFTYLTRDSNVHFVQALAALSNKEIWEERSKMLYEWSNTDYSEQEAKQSIIRLIED